LNDVLNVINRIVTADGLFQRLALMKSVQRDIAHISDTFWKSNTKEDTKEKIDAIRGQVKEPYDPAQLGRDLSLYYTSDSGPCAGLIGARAHVVESGANLTAPAIGF
jgi:hypothetical protein